MKCCSYQLFALLCYGGFVLGEFASLRGNYRTQVINETEWLELGFNDTESKWCYYMSLFC